MMKKSILIICLIVISAHFPNGAHGADVCVDNTSALNTALLNARTSGGDDIIRVVQGTYNGNFSYSSSQGHSLTLLGGYTAVCSERKVNPVNTILDAQDSGRVLDLIDTNGGNITVDGFTIQNGDYTGDGGGIYIESTSNVTAGNITLTNNIIKGNTSSSQGGGGVYARSDSQDGTAGTVTLVNNIITGNSANVGGGVFAS